MPAAGWTSEARRKSVKTRKERAIRAYPAGSIQQDLIKVADKNTQRALFKIFGLIQTVQLQIAILTGDPAQQLKENLNDDDD